MRLPQQARVGIEAQKRAADPERSVWVSASAGSGKTRVLVDRTLRLMLGGTAPQKILCITFTKAAASEMANRLNGILGNWAVAADAELAVQIEELTGSAPATAELMIARRLFAQVLDAPGGLKIQTIHSFCDSLLGRFPLESGISPNYEVMDERSAAEIMEASRDRLLMDSRKPDQQNLATALSMISERVNEQGFADILSDLSYARGRLRRLLRRPGGLDAVIGQLNSLLGVRADETELSVLEAAAAEDAFDGAGLKQAMDALFAGSDNDRSRAQILDKWLALPNERVSYFASYVRGFLTSDGAPLKRLATKKVHEALPGIVETLTHEAERLIDVKMRCNAVFVARSTEALLRLGGTLLDYYEAEKRRRGKLDYEDLILKARDLLSAEQAAPWVMYKLDGGIDHVLVDEAQDTSPDQWDVIAALVAEFFADQEPSEKNRTLFVVGDEKQSIYSFQGADPEAFHKMRAQFSNNIKAAKRNWEEVPMDMSFRSTEAVLALVDDVFQSAAASEGLSAGGAPIRHTAFRHGQAGQVELWPPVQPETHDDIDAWDVPDVQKIGQDPAAALAKNIAATIGGWLTSGEKLASKNRAIRPKDVMILVRRRNVFFEHMVRELKLAGIAVAGMDRMVLTDQIAVMDLIAMGKFVLLPEDDLNLAVLLKSPLVGCDDDDLFQIAHKRKGSLWRALREEKTGRPVFAEARAFLERQLNEADYVPVYEFYAQVLGSERGREKLLIRLGIEAADPIDEFLNLALSYQRREATSLQGFLHWVEAGGAVIKRDLEQDRDEVRVLTVHGSKGLQAPIVFLPDSCQPPASRQQIFWTDDALPFPLWPVKKAKDDPLCGALRAKAADRQMQEYRRLLYVALTRAEDRLYICGWQGSRSLSDKCWYKLVAPAFDQAGDDVDLPWGAVGRRRITAQSADIDMPAALPAPAKEVTDLPDWILAPPPAEPLPPHPLTPSKAEDEPTINSPLGDDDGYRFRRGNLIHRLLQSLPGLPAGDRAGAAKRWLALPSHMLSPAVQHEIARETLAVLSHTEFAPIFGPGSQAEVPLTGLLGNRILLGQIDRLVVTDDTVLIIDYKTNRPSPRNEAEVPAQYVRQMEIYYQALKKIYPEKSISCGLLWTDGPFLMPLRQIG